MGKSLDKIKKRAEAGDAEAQFELGLHYCAEEDNYDATLLWYRKAAEKGHAQAQFFLGGFLEDKGGRKPDIASALPWYQKAAAQGQPDALKRLGEMYEEGQCVPFDPDKADECFRKAVAGFRKEAEEDENYVAMSVLGLMLINGKGVARDLAEAAKWLEKAAELGDYEAPFILAGLHADGRGVPQDPGKAMELLRQAAANGHEGAKARLAALRQDGD